MTLEVGGGIIRGGHPILYTVCQYKSVSTFVFLESGYRLCGLLKDGGGRSPILYIVLCAYYTQNREHTDCILWKSIPDEWCNRNLPSFVCGALHSEP